MKKIMSTIGMLIIAISSPAWAATVTVGPSDCSAATVNAAIARASEGDTINLTCTGTVSWGTTAVKLSGGKRLKGPGSKAGNSWPLVISSNASPIVEITNVDDQRLNRLTGFKFNGNPGVNGVVVYLGGRGRGQSPAYTGAYRIDNNYFDNFSAISRVIFINGTAGELTGLTDNNYFYNCRGSEYIESYKGAGTCAGWDAWDRSFSFGSNRFNFFEDNYWMWDTSVNAAALICDGAGGKVVARYNTFNGNYYDLSATGIDGHGRDTGGGWGTSVRGGEVYSNYFTGQASGMFNSIYLRGGSWLVYDNILDPNKGGVIQLMEYRALGASGCTALDYPSPCATQPCKQCPTNSPEDLAACYPLPNQISGTYFWNNSVRPSVNSSGYVTDYIRENRDYWNATSLSDAKTKGLAPEYAPFTYPHPLRAGEINAPGGLRIMDK